MGRWKAILIAVMVCSGAFSIGLKVRLLSRDDPEALLPRGEPAPELELATLDGTAVDLARIAGDNELVVVNFWATWCQPCRIEMPQLERLYAEYGEQGLEVLAISAEDRATVETFLAAHPYSFPILLDPDGVVTRRYGVEAIPTTVMVDTDGHVIRTRTGVSPVLEAEIRALVGREEQQ